MVHTGPVYQPGADDIGNNGDYPGWSPQVCPLAALTSDIKHCLVFQIVMKFLSLKLRILRIHKYGRSRGYASNSRKAKADV